MTLFVPGVTKFVTFVLTGNFFSYEEVGLIQLGGLKLRIISTLTVFLSLAMGMTLFVTVMFWQRSTLRAVAHEIDMYLTYQVAELHQGKPGTPLNDSIDRRLIFEAKIVGGVVSYLDGTSEKFGVLPMREQTLSSHVYLVAEQGERATVLSGLTWGVVSPVRKFMKVAVPFSTDLKTVGAVGVLINLEPLYAQLRYDLRLILVYLLVNLIILVSIGLFRFISFTVRPVEDLVRLADSYEDDGLPFLSLERKSEYNLLSTSLNQMLQRIEQDKKQLQHSIASLESANRDLLSSRREVIQAEKLSSLGRMAGGLAHEIGNPIGIVQGYLGLLKDGLGSSDNENYEFIKRSEQEMQRIEKLLKQLLDLSRPSTTETGPVSIHKVLEDLLRLLQPHPLMTKISTSCQLNADNDIVHASRDQLQQVFLNCLMNAADAIHSKDTCTDGIIELSSRSSTERECRRIIIDISDNGVGIEKDNLTSVFDPFFTTKEPGKGTGLGLSVSHTLVESLGGSMGLSTNEKGGVTVTIGLPLYQETKDADLAVSQILRDTL